MADHLGKVAYSKPAQPEVITTADLALNAETYLNSDSGGRYASAG